MVQRETVRDSGTRDIQRIDRVVGLVLIALIFVLGAVLLCLGMWELALIMAIQ